MSSPERPSKQEAFLALLREGWTSLHLDARRPGVIVPAHLHGEAHLVLQYGHDLPIPILDFEVDEYGVRATLSFSKTPHLTVVPWSAVYVVACVDERWVLYHEDVPDDVSIVTSRVPGDHTLAEAEVTHEEVMEVAGHAGSERLLGTRSERFLRSVPAEPDAAATMSTSSTPGEPPVARRRRRPQLRLVK
jgi:stringent starvation protein B